MWCTEALSMINIDLALAPSKGSMFGIILDRTKSKIHSPLTFSDVYSADTKPAVQIAEIVFFLYS